MAKRKPGREYITNIEGESGTLAGKPVHGDNSTAKKTAFGLPGMSREDAAEVESLIEATLAAEESDPTAITDKISQSEDSEADYELELIHDPNNPEDYQYIKRYKQELNLLRENLKTPALHRVFKLLNYDKSDQTPETHKQILALLFLLFANFNSSDQTQILFDKITNDPKANPENDPFFIREITRFDFTALDKTESHPHQVRTYIHQILVNLIYSLN